MAVILLDAEALRADYLSRALSSVRTDRRALHRIPEIGRSEFLTHKYLWDALEQLRPDALSPIADTGIRCVFMGRADIQGARRRTIALRSDIDALNVSETTGLDFCSGRPGFTHACGHDGHMAY